MCEHSNAGPAVRCRLAGDAYIYGAAGAAAAPAARRGLQLVSPMAEILYIREWGHALSLQGCPPLYQGRRARARGRARQNIGAAKKRTKK